MTRIPKIQALYDCILCKKRNIPYYEIADKEMSICKDCQKKKYVITPADIEQDLNQYKKRIMRVKDLIE